MAKKNKYWQRTGFGGGTSLKGYVDCSYNTLVKIFGEPDPENSDGYKVAFEWVLTDKDNNTFTVYDYKNTTMYDFDLPTPDELTMLETVNWHVGGEDPDKANVFIAWLNEQIEKNEEEFVEVVAHIKNVRVRIPKRYVDNPEKSEDVDVNAYVKMAVNDSPDLLESYEEV